MSFLISAAHAAPAAGPTNGILPNILMIVVFVAIFYFLIWRPQATVSYTHLRAHET